MGLKQIKYILTSGFLLMAGQNLQNNFPNMEELIVFHTENNWHQGLKSELSNFEAIVQHPIQCLTSFLCDTEGLEGLLRPNLKILFCYGWNLSD